MSNSSVENVIHGYISEELDDDDVAVELDTRLFETGLVDSMNLVRLLAFLEGKFEIKIPVAMVNDKNFATVTSIASLVDSLATQSP